MTNMLQEPLIFLLDSYKKITKKLQNCLTYGEKHCIIIKYENLR